MITWDDIVEMYRKISTPAPRRVIIVGPELYAQAVDMFGAERVIESAHLPPNTAYAVEAEEPLEP